MCQRILVPLDGSQRAETALSLACTLASVNDAEITVLRVLEYPSELYSSFYPNLPADPALDEKIRLKKETIHSSVKGYLEHLASSAENRRNVSYEIQEGPVVDAILNTAQKLKIDLIVMSSIGNDQNIWMVGCIASRILREAQVPVILMRDGSGSSVPDSSFIQKTPLEKKPENYYEYSR